MKKQKTEPKVELIDPDDYTTDYRPVDWMAVVVSVLIGLAIAMFITHVIVLIHV